MELPDPDTLVDEQIAYYRARAPEYDQWSLRVGRFDQGDNFAVRWEREKRLLHDWLLEFDPRGDVLELAAGTGNVTAQLASIADRVTAVDASPEALAIAAEKIAGTSADVDLVVADLFAWEPLRRYDAVVFGFWLSHVPLAHVRAFWDLVDRALADDGRVFLLDNAVPLEQAAAVGGREPRVDRQRVTPTSTTWIDRGVSLRELNDGRRFHIVKRAWEPHALAAELANLGWRAEVRLTGDFFIAATVTRD